MVSFECPVLGSNGLHIRVIRIGSQPRLSGTPVGGFQFWSTLRGRFPAFHRWMGRAYLTLVLSGGVGGFILAMSADGGLVARFGFAMLDVIWLFSAAQAYLAIRRGDVRTHRDWMVRNFALTLGAVTLRLYLGFFAAAGMPFSDAYPVVAWLSWVPNPVLVEWIFALRGKSAHIDQSSGSLKPLPRSSTIIS